MNCKVKPQTTDLHLKKIRLKIDWLANFFWSLADKSGFILIFTCLKMKLFPTFWGIYSMASRIYQKLSLNTSKYCQLISFSDNRKSCWQPEFRPLCNNGILLPKLFWPTMRNNCSSHREKLLRFEAEGREFEFFFEITRTIYSNSERSKQFLVTECFFNLLLEVSLI